MKSRGLSDSFSNAARGVRTAINSERNLRMDLAAALAVVAAGFYLGLSLAEWSIIVMAIAMVIAMEMINTAIENFADRVAPNYDQAVGAAKDLAAGAVLVTAMGAAVVGILVLGPHFIRILGGTVP